MCVASIYYLLRLEFNGFIHAGIVRLSSFVAPSSTKYGVGVEAHIARARSVLAKQMLQASPDQHLSIASHLLLHVNESATVVVEPDALIAGGEVGSCG
jgi:hypothetical protein